jgi:hypothetical protein
VLFSHLPRQLFDVPINDRAQFVRHLTIAINLFYHARHSHIIPAQTTRVKSKPDSHEQQPDSQHRHSADQAPQDHKNIIDSHVDPLLI